MSDENEDEVAAEAVPDEAVAEKPAAEPEPAADKTPKPRNSGSSSLAWLALFMSLVTLAAVGYMLMEDFRAQEAVEASHDSISELSGRVAESTRSLSDIDRNISELSTSDQGLQSRIEALQTDMQERVRLLDSLPARMSNIERSVAALQGVSAGARDTWLLAEAEYYLQIANAQLQLAKNPHLAMLALGMADERVVQMSDPALTDVRRSIADELAALEVMDKPDIEGVVLTLASLSRVVDSLPLHTIGSDAEGTDTESGDDLSGTARAWASVKSAVSGLVRVTPPDESTRDLLTPDAAQLIRSNLALQLQAARLALLRSEQAIFEQSLDDAEALLSQYFDTGSVQVDGARQTIAEIRANLFAVTPPDISESLRLLRQYRTLSENAQ